LSGHKVFDKGGSEWNGVYEGMPDGSGGHYNDQRKYLRAKE